MDFFRAVLVIGNYWHLVANWSVFMGFYWGLTFYGFLHRLLKLSVLGCSLQHTVVPQGTCLFWWGGEAGAVKSHSSILQFTTSLPPSFYFHCAIVNVAPTAGTCLLPLVLQSARISVFFEASKILPHQIKKMLCSHRGSESICWSRASGTGTFSEVLHNKAL